MQKLKWFLWNILGIDLLVYHVFAKIIGVLKILKYESQNNDSAHTSGGINWIVPILGIFTYFTMVTNKLVQIISILVDLCILIQFK